MQPKSIRRYPHRTTAGDAGICCSRYPRDGYEGVASGDYERIIVTVKKDSGEAVEAISYVAGDGFVCKSGKPSAKNLLKITSGARHHSLPDEYVVQIELLAK